MLVMVFLMKRFGWSVSLWWKVCLRFLEEVARAGCVGLGVVNSVLLPRWQRVMLSFLALGVRFSDPKLCGVSSW